MSQSKTYILNHLILQADALGFEEVLQGLLFLPIDVAELVFAQSGLQTNRDIKGPAGRDRTAHTRHRHHGNILQLDVGSGLGNKDEALVQEVQRPFVGLDRTLDSMVAVVAANGQKSILQN